MLLLLEEIHDAGAHEVATLDGRVYVLGRDLTCDIPLAHTALSRTHGEFLPFPSGWIFLDLGSTNGSWINGQKIAPGRYVGLRNGDYLQLADCILRVRYRSTWSGSRGSRLLVLKDRIPFREVEVPLDGTPLTVGGIETTFEVTGYEERGTIGQFYWHEDSLLLDLHEIGVGAAKNGAIFDGHVRVAPNDNITIREYQFVFVQSVLAPVHGGATTTPEVQRVAIGVDLTSVPSSTPLLGESEGQVFSPTHTVAVKVSPGTFTRFGEKRREEDEDVEDTVESAQSPAVVEMMRSLFDFETMTDIERRLVIGIVFFLGMSLFLFILWLFFF